MTGDAVLIAAFSGRSLAQSARRAGFRPLVVDAFGDLDTRAAAEDIRVIDGAMATGFRTKPVVAALNQLSQAAGSKPLGLVLGSGFEDKPRLMAALGSRFHLLGSSAETLSACKDPAKFFKLLDELGVPHPETQVAPPVDARGWISKRIGGSGGRHIRDCGGHPQRRPRRYFQKKLSGTRYSVGALLAPDRSRSDAKPSFAVTKQWTAPALQMPYRFGGCVSMPDIDEALSKDLIASASRVAERLNLVGMTSFDFIVDGSVPYLLEINPRPGASLDVLDDAAGSMFVGHVAACTRRDIHSPQAGRMSKAMAILHADRGPITLGDLPWPKWSADRGAAGTFVPQGAPLASVFAEAPTADAAEALARTRLAELEDLIYGHPKSG